MREAGLCVPKCYQWQNALRASLQVARKPAKGSWPRRAQYYTKHSAVRPLMSPLHVQLHESHSAIQSAGPGALGKGAGRNLRCPPVTCQQQLAALATPGLVDSPCEGCKLLAERSLRPPWMTWMAFSAHFLDQRAQVEFGGAETSGPECLPEESETALTAPRSTALADDICDAF